MKSKIYMSGIRDTNDCPFMGQSNVVCENWGKNLSSATHICSCEWTRKENRDYETDRYD